MSEIRIAARYAKSLITLATENGDLDVIHKDMQIVSESCKGSRELVLALRSPLIKFDKKRSILNAIFKDKVSSFTISFFRHTFDTSGFSHCCLSTSWFSHETKGPYVLCIHVFLWSCFTNVLQLHSTEHSISRLHGIACSGRHWALP